MNLETLWRQLETGGPAQPGITRIAAGGSTAGRIYAAFEVPGVGAMMLLRVPREHMRSVTGQDGDGLELRWLQLDGDPSHAYLSLTPHQGADRSMFALVAQDIAEHVIVTSGAEEAIRALTGRLASWRGFLKTRGGGLGALALRGLFGELWFIRERLIPRATALSVLSAWTGPGRAAQDFRFGKLRMDVKTTASVDASIEISSAQQLVVTPGQRLLLAHLVLEGHSHGESVPELVASLRSAVSGEPRGNTLLDERLLQMGYHSTDEHRYSEPRLRVIQSHLYEVREDFPRLIPDMLPAGVNNVQYSIDPGRCSAFIQDPTVALNDLVATP